MLLSARGRHNAEFADHRDYDERANGVAVKLLPRTTMQH
jgi:hypothetical protein